MNPLKPFDRGRTPQEIRASIVEYTGADYPLLGLIIELEGAVAAEAHQEGYEEAMMFYLYENGGGTL